MSILPPTMPARPDDKAPFAEKLNWLLFTHAYFAKADRVVELYEASEDCMLAWEAFQRVFKPWSEPRTGPMGGKLPPASATGMWEVLPMRLAIAGIRMRPDREFPVYEEGGELFKNIYRKPEHDGTGDLKPFLKFMLRFLPSRRERRWALDWMAHKLRYPQIPGTAVLLVADSEYEVRTGRFGTGRGLMFKILSKLYGAKYVIAQDFDILDGSSSQAAYTDWLHNRLLATVDESKSSPTSYRRGERNAAYEVLKNIVDPAPKQRFFKGKYRPAFDGMQYISFWVATNHADALAIPAKDRRFTVLTNGRGITAEEAKAIAAWMEEPGNIAALAGFLAARDLTGFNMFEPLDTEAKAEMAELAISRVEEVLIDLMEDKERGLVFTRTQVEKEVENMLSGGGGRSLAGYHWRNELNGLWSKYCALLKTVIGTAWRVRVDGKQKKLYCFRTRKRQAERLPEAARRAQAAKWGEVDELKDLLKTVAAGAVMESRRPEDVFPD